MKQAIRVSRENRYAEEGDGKPDMKDPPAENPPGDQGGYCMPVRLPMSALLFFPPHFSVVRDKGDLFLGDLEAAI